MTKILLLAVMCCFYSIIEAHEPIPPKEWQTIAGPGGFATSWFRSVLGFEKKYLKKNIADVYAKGFRNLRLRCRTGYPKYDMARQVRDLEVVVDDCLKVGVVPIVAWLNHRSEAEATDDQRKAYVNWWKTVATALKGKDYRLAYNLFEEIGLEKNPGKHCVKLNKEAYAKKTGEHFACPEVGGQSLRENLWKYKEWTQEAVDTIRKIDPHRIIILSSPKKTGEFLKDIPQDIYRKNGKNDDYMMAEWHIYASGPSKKLLKNGRPEAKYWNGNGNKYGKRNVDKNLAHAQKWTKETGILTYFGAWMPQDNIKANITMAEAIAFETYFVGQLKAMGLPWTLNALEIYYDTQEGKWIKGVHEHVGMHITQKMNWSKLLSVTQSVMNAPAPQIGTGGKEGKEEKKGNGGGGKKGGNKGKKGGNKDKKGGNKGKKGGNKGKKGGNKGKKGEKNARHDESVYDEVDGFFDAFLRFLQDD